MEKVIKKYIEETGAFGATAILEHEKYGKIYQLQYGHKNEDGNVNPTGLPVLAYIKNGEVIILPDDTALDLLASLGE